jgi:hypothetical protein
LLPPVSSAASALCCVNMPAATQSAKSVLSCTVYQFDPLKMLVRVQQDVCKFYEKKLQAICISVE